MHYVNEISEINGINETNGIEWANTRGIGILERAYANVNASLLLFIIYNLPSLVGSFEGCSSLINIYAF